MKTSSTFLLAVGLLFIGTQLLAQGAPPATPIDGGLSLALIATGAALGIKKFRSKK